MVNPISTYGFSAGHINGNFTQLEAFLDRLVRAGAGHCELYIGELDVVSGGRVLPDRLRRFRAICEARSLAYTFHLPLVANLTDPSRISSDQQVLSTFIDVAGEINADVLVLHPGRMPAGLTISNRESLLGHERERLWYLAERAAVVGASLSLENPPPSRDVVVGKIDAHGLNPYDVLSQVKRTEHPSLHATLDFSHAWIAASYCGFDFIEAIKALAPAVGHLHIHDSHGKPPLDPQARFSDEVAYGVYDLHLPVGWGTVPFEEAMSGLPIAPRSRVTIELLERFWDELEATLAATRALCQMLPTSGQ